MLETIAVAVLLAVMAFLFYRDVPSGFPTHVHAWSQSDHYALARGFQENGYNFFLAETHSLNPQFPAEIPLEDPQGKTAVDFPIHDYIPAVLMGIYGKPAPKLHRLYILLYSLIGLIFLFRLARLGGLDIRFTWLLLAFALATPVFLTYQWGFLPSLPSIANLIIGSFFLFRHLKTESKRDFLWAVIFFTFAALARTPFAIWLIALAGFEFLRILRAKKINWQRAISLTSGFALVGGYFLYNGYLRKHYGSIFLSSPLPPESLDEFSSLVSEARFNWSGRIFNVFQHIFLVGLIATVLISKPLKKLHETTENGRQFTQFFLIAALGVGLYSLLMTRQFVHHDYYFLDTFFPVILVAVFLLLRRIGCWRNGWKWAGFVLGGLLLLWGMFEAKAQMDDRYRTKDWDRTELTRQNFWGGDQLLDELSIPANASLLVLDAYAPNVPLMLLNRKGFTTLSTRPEVTREALDFDFDYAVLQDTFLLTDIAQGFPAIIDSLIYIGGNGKISVYEPARGRPGGFAQFAGMAGKDTAFHSFRTFDQPDSTPGWFPIVTVPESPGDSVHQKIVGSPENPFPVVVQLKDSLLPHSGQFTALFQCDLLADSSLSGLFLAVAVVHPDVGTHFYRQIDLNDYLAHTGEAETLFFKIPVDLDLHANDEVKVQLWNSEGAAFEMDNVYVGVFSE